MEQTTNNIAIKVPAVIKRKDRKSYKKKRRKMARSSRKINRKNKK